MGLGLTAKWKRRAVYTAFLLPLALPPWERLPAVQTPQMVERIHVVPKGASETVRGLFDAVPAGRRPDEAGLARIASLVGASSPDAVLKAGAIITIPRIEMRPPSGAIWDIVGKLWWARGILCAGLLLALPTVARRLRRAIVYPRPSSEREADHFELPTRSSPTHPSGHVVAGVPRRAPKTPEAPAPEAPATPKAETSDSKTPGFPTDQIAIARALAARVVGNAETVSSLARWVAYNAHTALRGAARGKPGCVFVPGPSGVGKTELAKALAAATGAPFFRFDMGRYSSDSNVWDLFGPSRGFRGAEAGGHIPNALRKAKDSGAAVLLFDECEKADPAIWQSMLAFLDEGRAQDVLGDVAAPPFTLCVFTSNLAGASIRTQDPEEARMAVEGAGYFSQEFLGRIDHYAPMARLSDEEEGVLVGRVLTRIFAECRLDVRHTPDDALRVARLCRDQMATAGARGAERYLKRVLADELIRAMGTTPAGRLRLVFGASGEPLIAPL